MGHRPIKPVPAVPRRPIESPCKGVCAVNPLAGLCIGCFRTVDEISHWVTLEAAERDRVMAELPGREAAFMAYLDSDES